MCSLSYILFYFQLYVESVCGGESEAGGREERVLVLPPALYHALAARRADLAAAASAHLLWDSDTSSIVLLGTGRAHT